MTLKDAADIVDQYVSVLARDIPNDGIARCESWLPHSRDKIIQAMKLLSAFSIQHYSFTQDYHNYLGSAASALASFVEDQQAQRINEVRKTSGVQKLALRNSPAFLELEDFRNSEAGLSNRCELSEFITAIHQLDPEDSLYYHRVYALVGLEYSPNEDVKWFRKAAEQSNAGAQWNLGLCYQFGECVERNDAEAVKWFRKAAEQNNSCAQLSLGRAYYHGTGVEENPKEAMKWYRKAAEQNHAEAQSNLGFCYELGTGVKKDFAEALKWYRKAAEQNSADAQSCLGICYEFGKGAAKNCVEAYAWYSPFNYPQIGARNVCTL